ncbi:MAG TPA: hypothetical protein VGB99_03665 [Acidobacteriota bacterium]
MTHFKTVIGSVGALICAAIAPAPAALAQSNVGAPGVGETAWTFIGRSEQENFDVTHFGYLTHIAGLDDADLFEGSATPTEANARFTYYASTALDTRNEVENIITTTAQGSLKIYFNANPSGDFDDPESFRDGVEVAEYSLAYHNVLNVQQPNEGVIDSRVDLKQESSDSFSLDGSSFSFGKSRLRFQLNSSGQGTKTQDEPFLRAFFLLGGNVVVVRKK